MELPLVRHPHDRRRGSRDIEGVAASAPPLRLSGVPAVHPRLGGDDSYQPIYPLVGVADGLLTFVFAAVVVVIMASSRIRSGR